MILLTETDKIYIRLFAVVVHVTLPLLLCQLVRAISVVHTSDQNDHNTKAMTYQNSEQMHEPWLEPVSNGY